MKKLIFILFAAVTLSSCIKYSDYAIVDLVSFKMDDFSKTGMIPTKIPIDLVVTMRNDSKKDLVVKNLNIYVTPKSSKNALLVVSSPQYIAVPAFSTTDVDVHLEGKIRGGVIGALNLVNYFQNMEQLDVTIDAVLVSGKKSKKLHIRKPLPKFLEMMGLDNVNSLGF